jgi:4-amino-4-deoxychorismate lyase
MVPADRVLVDGQPQDRISVFDRGLGYGDGLFESIRFVAGAAPLWRRHMRRLEDGCRRLQLPGPDGERLLEEARGVVAGLAQAVARITLTRGVGPRGYAPPVPARATRIVAGFEAPPVRTEDLASGIRVRLCAVRLAEQPLLAGIKHLNRLEQVMARAEWSDPAIAEGLLCDSHGHVISATMANLFAVIDGELVTPAVDRCGIAGVGRAEVLATWPTRVRQLKLDELAGAGELFLSSSVRGILPVRELEGRPFAVGPVTRAMQQHWHSLGFSMEAG